MADQPRSAQELVRVLRGQGISVAEIAGVLNRSPRMVRKVEAGQTSGASTAMRSTSSRPRGRRPRSRRGADSRTARSCPCAARSPTARTR